MEKTLNFVPEQEESTTITTTKVPVSTTTTQTITTLPEGTAVEQTTTITITETPVTTHVIETADNKITCMTTAVTVPISQTTTMYSGIYDDSNDEETQLPETGNHSLNMAAIVTAAFILTLIGTFVVLRFEVIYRCKGKK